MPLSKYNHAIEVLGEHLATLKEALRVTVFMHNRVVLEAHIRETAESIDVLLHAPGALLDPNRVA